MLRHTLTLMLLAASAIGCTSEPERQWMKPGPYTTAEFKRDVAACTRGGRLDDKCMQGRGWEAMTTNKSTDPRPEERVGRGVRR